MNHRHIFFLLASAFAADTEGEGEQGRRKERGRQRHDDRNAEDLFIQDRSAHIHGGHTDTGDNEGNFTTGDHAAPDTQRADHAEVHKERGQCATDHFSSDRHQRIDHAQLQHFRIRKDPDVNQHTHDHEEDRHKEGSEGFQRSLDRKRNIRFGQAQAHDIRADDHSKTVLFKDAGEDQRQTKGERGENDGTSENLEEFCNVTGKKQTDCRCHQPETDTLRRDDADLSPVNRTAGAAGAHNAENNCKADNTENVVDHRSGKDRYAFRRIHFLLFRQDASGNAHAGCSTENAQEHGNRVHPGKSHQIDTDSRAQPVGEDHPADPDDRADQRVTEEHPQVRFQTGHEQQENGTDCGKRIKGGMIGLERDVFQSDCRLFSCFINPVSNNIRRKTEQTVFQVDRIQRNAPLDQFARKSGTAKHAGTDENTGTQFPQHGGHFQFFGKVTAKLRGENDDTQLKRENRDLLHNAQMKVQHLSFESFIVL